MYKKFVSLPNLTLLVALSLSTVAAYYSIIGLTAIFAGAVLPVIIMGSMLEVAKITTTVWLRKYWNRAGWVIKLYLVPAVVALALLTSMGIFGFLSKAHMDQGITSGDSQAKLALYDEKIKTQRDNIELARKALTQMDAQVDQMLGRTDSDKGAERAVAIRKQQAKERTSLQNDIGLAQKEIQKLNEERAPIAAENRKIEAEVGPIKYIAALIYGDNADANMLEAAVRWVIILLVIVFDPLAIALVLAGNQSKEWDEEEGDSPIRIQETEQPTVTEPAYEPDDGPINEEALAALRDKIQEELPTGNLITKSELFPEPVAESTEIDYSKHTYLNQGFGPPMPEEFRVGPQVHTPEPKKVDFTQGNYVNNAPEFNGYDIVLPEPAIEPAPMPEPSAESIERPGDYIIEPEPEDTSVMVMPKIELPYTEESDGYIIYDGRHMSKDALKGMHPELFALTADNATPIRTNFGIKFPEIANKGDIFVRVDMLPNRVYKFDGRSNWIEVNKEKTDTYLHNQKYLQHLVNMIDSGQYDVELLSENERIEIEEYLSNQKLDK